MSFPDDGRVAMRHTEHDVPRVMQPMDEAMQWLDKELSELDVEIAAMRDTLKPIANERSVPGDCHTEKEPMAYSTLVSDVRSQAMRLQVSSQRLRDLRLSLDI